MAKHIFISYDRTDSDRALQIARDLEAKGLKIWIDQQIGGGTEWEGTIEEKLKSAGEAVFLLSPDAIQSRWVQHEGSLAYAWKVPICPVLLSEVPSQNLPIWAKRFQCIDFMDDDYQKCLDRLLTSLTPPNPVQDLLEQQMDIHRQTGALIGSAILRVIEEARDTLDIDADSEELIRKSAAHQEEEERRWKELAEESERQRQIAVARQLAAESELIWRQSERLADRSALLAAESIKRLLAFDRYSAAANQTLRQVLSIVPKHVQGLVHRGSVDFVAFSPDGRFLVTVSRRLSFEPVRSEVSAHVWQVEGGRSVFDREIDAFRIEAIALASDNNQLVMALSDSTALVFDLSTGREVARLGRIGENIHTALSSDGLYFVTTCGDGIASVWDARSGSEVARLSTEGTVISIAFVGRKYVAAILEDNRMALVSIPEGRRISCFAVEGRPSVVTLSDRFVAVLEGGNEVVVRTLATGDEVARLLHDAKVTSLAFDEGGHYLGTGCEDGTAQIWEIADGRRVTCVRHQDQVQALAISRINEHFATASSDRTARVWDFVGGRELARMVHDDVVGAIAFSPNGGCIATGSWDATARLWGTLADPCVVCMRHEGEVRQILYSPDGSRLAAVERQEGLKDRIQLWHAETGEKAACMSHDGFIVAMAFFSDGSHLVSAGWDGTVRIWDTTSGRELARMTHRAIILDLDVSPDDRYVATACRDGSLCVWSASSGGGVWTREAPENEGVKELKDLQSVNCLAFSHDGKYVAAGVPGNALILCETVNGREAWRVRQDARSMALSFSPKGELMATANSDKTASLWDSVRGKELARLPHDRNVTCLAFSSDGSKLATASSLFYELDADPERKAAERSNGIVRIWSVVEAREVIGLRHEGAIDAMAFSPDGKFLATASQDNVARIWRVDSGSEAVRLTQERSLTDVAFCSGGEHVATASTDGTARSWRWRPEDQLREVGTRVRRNLTPDEWSRYLEGEPYKKTFPDLP